MVDKIAGDKAGISRQDAYSLAVERLKNSALIKHCLATEAIMRSLAEKLGKDADMWGIAGLLHDLDYEETKNHPEKHALITGEILSGRGVNHEIIDAIKSHNAEALNLERKTNFHYAITAAENITGLIVATALVQPDKKLSQVKPESVIKRMKEKHFARNVDREAILLCTNIGMSLDEFVRLSIGAMSGIAGVLGL